MIRAKALETALFAIQGAGVALAQLKANGKISLDEDGCRWVEDIETSLSDAEDALADLEAAEP